MPEGFSLLHQVSAERELTDGSRDSGNVYVTTPRDVSTLPSSSNTSRFASPRQEVPLLGASSTLATPQGPLEKMAESSGVMKHFRFDRVHPLVMEDHNRMVHKLNRRRSMSWQNKSFAISAEEDPTIPQEGHLILSNVLAGIVCGIKVSIGMAVFASLQWGQNPKLAKYLNLGVRMNYFTATVLILAYARTGGIPFGMVLCQDIPCLLLGRMSKDLDKYVEEEYLVHNFVVLIALQTISSGLLFWLAGYFNWTTFAQSVPTSVVGGFVASCGVSLWKAAFVKITNVRWVEHGFWPTEWLPLLEPKRYWLFITGMVVSLLVKEGPAWLRRSTNSYFLKSLSAPIFTFGPVAIFYAVIQLTHHTIEDARSAAWLPAAIPVKMDITKVFSFWSHWVDIVQNPSIINWHVIVLLAPHISVCALLSLLELVFNVAGIDTVMGDHHVDLRQEAQSIGIANIISGLLGGNMGYLQSSMTLAAKQIDNASHRLCLLVAAAFSAILFVSGIPAATVIPKFVSSAFFIVTGWFFIKKWVIDSWYCLPQGDINKILSIILVSIVFDIELAILWGFIINLVSFNLRSLRVNRVKSIERGDTHHSNKTLQVRQLEEANYLIKEGHKIMIIRCCGFLYWGDASQIVRIIMDAVVNTQVLVRYLIIDFTNVLEMDLSAVKAFDKCLTVALHSEHGRRVCFAGADQKIGKYLSDRELAAGHKGHGWLGTEDHEKGEKEFLAEYFATLDKALEVYEDSLLDNRDDGIGSLAAKSFVARFGSQGAFDMSGDLCRKFKSLAAEMSSDAKGVIAYHMGQTVLEVGELPELLIILDGKVSYSIAGSDSEATMHGPDSIVGALAFALERPSQASIVAEEPTHVLHVCDRVINYMKEQDLATYVKFQDFIMGVLRVEARSGGDQ